MIMVPAGRILCLTHDNDFDHSSPLGHLTKRLLQRSAAPKFAIFQNPGLFLLGFIWIGFHVTLLIIVAKLIRAPFFFVAVGSQANVGGAASAPVVAAAFHPSLAAVGVLLAVLGYAVGTYAAYICGIIMQNLV